MAEGSDHRAALEENLTDAGCEPELCGQVTALLAQGRRQEAMALLKRHRRKVLECCHAEQKKLDCLDYFIYTAGKEDEV